MILAGGLLRLYWDSGTPVTPPPPPPPPAPDDLPLGLENTARPNVSVRWGNRRPEPAMPSAPIEPAPLPPAEDAAIPVPLALVLRAAAAAPRTTPAGLHAVCAALRAPAAAAQPEAFAAAAGLRAVPALAVIAACAMPVAAAVAPQPQADDRTSAETARRARNRRAIEIAMRLLDED